MIRKLLIFTIVVVSVVSVVFSWNYISLQKNISEIVESDPRNRGVSVVSHFNWYINPNVIVFDIRGISPNKSRIDVSRFLLQFSEKLKDNEYERIILSFKGESKFMLKGDFFKEIGLKHGIQNPIYTLRTLPQHVYNIDGTNAFVTRTGRWMGVLGQQMDDLNAFHSQWYLNELELDF
jgi:hypothetical protein